MADVSVRVARGSDGEALAAVQVACWRYAYAGVLPAAALAALTEDTDGLARRWRESADGPPSPRHHVLVACEDERVVGGAALAPSDDEDLDPVADGEVLTFLVAPGHRGSGHGSRLLNASAGHLRDDGFARGTVWLDETDVATRGLFGTAGWGDDGAARVLDMDGDGVVVLRQVRLHTDLGEDGR